MLSGESVTGLADDLGTATPRGVLPIDDPVLCQAVESMEAAWASVADMESSTLNDGDKRALMARMETLSRAMYGTSHTWLTELIENDGLLVLPDRTNPSRLASLLRVDPSVAGKRIKIATKLSVRQAMTGEKLEPEYPATAVAHRDGHLDAAHVSIIDKFFDSLPSAIDHESKLQSEILLADLGKQVAPEQLRVAALRLTALLDPDGTLQDDKDPLTKCYFTLGKQDSDGLSKGSFVIDAEFRAYLEPVLAKLAKAGNLNPDEPHPVSEDLSPTGKHTDNGDSSGGDDSDEGGNDSDDGGDEEPTLFDKRGSDDRPGDDDETGNDDKPGCDGKPGGDAHDAASADEHKRRAGRDTRSQGRRNHDALKAVLRQMLASGALGEHRGLPVTAVISMTAAELREASGHAVTGTGSLIPIRDAIRMASHAHQYLVIFDDRDGRALYLARSKRLATADQRIVLIARDRGCTFPACTRPATWSQVHHIDEWADGGHTDIDSLTFGCDLHHPLVGKGPNNWATTTTGPDHPQPGRTQWHPPDTVDPDRRGIVNHYHHPQEYLYDDPEDSQR